MVTSPGNEDGGSGVTTPTVAVRAAQLLRVRTVWVTPIAVSIVLVFLMTLFYVGSIVNPAGHLSGLPVLIADQDQGATVGSQHVDIGAEVASALKGTPAVASRLTLDSVSLSGAEQEMGRNGAYATIVIPPDFTDSLLAAYGLSPASTGKPTVRLLTNPRSGSVGVSLATGVADPALSAASRSVGHKLTTEAAKVGRGARPGVSAANPLTVVTTAYRPVPANSALGLSAFYVSLLSIMCGFLGAILVNSTIDAALGYGTTEIGPKFRQRMPLAISRWQTLLAKWCMALVVVPILTGVLLLVAVGVLHMDAPYVGLLWVFTSFAGIAIAAGTLALFAALGTLGQLVAMLLFVYLALASSGGTIPLQALPSFYRFVANFEPLRQVLDGVRAILYFDAAGDAGLTRGFVLTAIGLVLWLVVGVAVTRWYDRRGLDRMQPEVLQFVQRSTQSYAAAKEAGTAAPAAPAATAVTPVPTPRDPAGTP
jgi:YhgE/Pip-like protein